jgi:hypothetical protein
VTGWFRFGHFCRRHGIVAGQLTAEHRIVPAHDAETRPDKLPDDSHTAGGIDRRDDVPNFHRIVVHGSTVPLEWLKVTIDPAINAPRGPTAFGPFAWSRMIQP